MLRLGGYVGFIESATGTADPSPNGVGPTRQPDGRSRRPRRRSLFFLSAEDTRRIPPRGVRIDLAPLLQIQPRRPCSRRLLEA